MTKVRLREGVLLQRIHDETVVFDLTAERFYSLDSVATRFWELLSVGESPESVIATVVKEYDVAEATVAVDLERFCGELDRLGLIERC